MGSNGSKTHSSVTATAEFTTQRTVKPEFKFTDNVLLDPRSPDVNRTPLASILNNRLNKRQNIEPVTPVNLRKQLLNYSAKELKLLDPRSPSQFIPRTPLNMSFNSEHLERSQQQYSLEYSGDIEEASCRNFNERLANITFDDLQNEAEQISKMLTANKLETIEDISIQNATSNEDERQLSDAECDEQRSHTPIDDQSKNAMDIDGENISPVIDPTSTNTRNAPSTFSSTPISTQTNQLKSLLQKKHAKKSGKTEIFTDNSPNNGLELETPPKRLAKITEIEKPRTPFGCLLNRRSKSFENLSQQSFGLKESARSIHVNNENATPKKQKSTALLKHVNRSGGLRKRNEIFHD